MKIFVVFGSQSDENVSRPLVDALKKDHEVESAFISAHRDLEKLQRKIASWQGDALVAGAGLAAALPGVVAAMSPLPVFGVPVPSQFGGLDSLASIAQMPPGVPVMTAGPQKTTDAIAHFLKNYKMWKKTVAVHFVCPVTHADLTAEIEKAAALAREKEITVTASATPEAGAFNVYVVTKPEDVKPDAFGLHMPFMPKAETQKPENYLAVLDWANRGGLWVGVNNARNAMQSFFRLAGLTLPAILYRGSVKNVRGVEGKSPYIFEFSDRYSIFDWGQMPDELNDKGAALAVMARFFFDFMGDAANWKNWQAPAVLANERILGEMKKNGVAHHALDKHGLPARCLAVEPVAVPDIASKTENGKLTWDYGAYAARPEKTLVPLEVIFRFGITEGSSLLSRAGDAAYCKAIGLSSAPKPGDRFEMPVIEFSTKLETSDRYIPYDEAAKIAGLNAQEAKDLPALAKLLALRLKDCFADIGVELVDGKFEFGFGGAVNGVRAFMLVDSIGPDELRLIKNGVHLSKEALRGVYRPTPWYKAVETAKQLAKERGEKDWKRICADELKSAPAPLPADIRTQAEMIYRSLAKALTKTHFPDAWSLDDVVKSFQVKKQDVA